MYKEYNILFDNRNVVLFMKCELDKIDIGRQFL